MLVQCKNINIQNCKRYRNIPPTIFVHTHNVLLSMWVSCISIGCYLPSRLLSDVSGPSFVLTYVFHAKLLCSFIIIIIIEKNKNFLE